VDSDDRNLPLPSVTSTFGEVSIAIRVLTKALDPRNNRWRSETASESR